MKYIPLTGRVFDRVDVTIKMFLIKSIGYDDLKKRIHDRNTTERGLNLWQKV